LSYVAATKLRDKRVLIRTLWAALLMALSLAPSEAQDVYPARAVKVIVPSTGGSTTDILARIVVEQLSMKWSKPVIVDNVGGAGMVIGATLAARSLPDGYTLFICPPSPVTFMHLLHRELPFEPTQFVPIALLARVPNALVVRNDFPASNLKELIAYAKANPGKVTFASTGVGSTAHLSATQIELLADLKMVHVPYRGAAPALNDVAAGHVDLFFDTMATSIPMYRAGKVKILAVGSLERSAVVPEIPTVSEAGLPGFRSLTWFAMVAPPGFQPALAAQINRDVVDILRRPEVDATLQRLTLEPMIGSPADAEKFFAEETAQWGRVIRQGNVTAD
jgi:tripartite-type tricarboxylate transporter receptor subunit TctC